MDIPVAFKQALFIEQPRLGQFYLQPKTHRDIDLSLPFHYPAIGIISMSADPYEGFGRLMHILLSPCTRAPYSEDHLQDTSEFVRVMDQARAGTFRSSLGSNRF